MSFSLGLYCLLFKASLSPNNNSPDNTMCCRDYYLNMRFTLLLHFLKSNMY